MDFSNSRNSTVLGKEIKKCSDDDVDNILDQIWNILCSMRSSLRESEIEFEPYKSLRTSIYNDESRSLISMKDIIENWRGLLIAIGAALGKI